MKWGELLAQLDAVRSKLRAEHGKELDKEIPEGNLISQEAKAAVGILHEPMMQPEEPDPLFAIAPLPEPQRKPNRPGSTRMAANSVEGATLVIEPRQPFVPQKPVLEEVTEEGLAR